MKLGCFSVVPTTKGAPNDIEKVYLADVPNQKWNVLKEDLPLPLALLKHSAIEGNRHWMREFLEKNDVQICPHGKTTMSSQLFMLQFEDGAWGMTIATLHQLKVCRKYKVSRVMMANQLIGKNAIEYVMSELDRDPKFEFYCLTDSAAHVEHLASIARNYNSKLNVLVECGYKHGRAGCRDVATALEVARKVDENKDCLSLAGVEGYEGNIHGEDDDDTMRLIHEYLTFVLDVASQVDDEDLFAVDNVILTLGGTAYYDLAIDYLNQAELKEKATLITRSGCYLLHDSKYYDDHFKHIVERNVVAAEIKPAMQHSVEVWAYVQSVPEDNLAILNFGKRDASYDVTMPIPLYWYRQDLHEKPHDLTGCEVFAMDDQHAFLRIPDNCELQVGDMVACGVSHPCTTFDKWQWMPLVDDNYTVIDAITTNF